MTIALSCRNRHNQVLSWRNSPCTDQGGHARLCRRQPDADARRVGQDFGLGRGHRRRARRLVLADPRAGQFRAVQYISARFRIARPWSELL